MSTKLTPKPLARRSAGRLLVRFTDAQGNWSRWQKGPSRRYLKRVHQSGRCHSHCAHCITEAENYLAAQFS